MTRLSTWLRTGLLGSLFGLFAAAGAGAAETRLDPGGFRDEDREVAEEIASFSAEDRHAALVAAAQPEELLEMQRIQRATADRFTKLVEAYPREDQEQIWNLIRFPGLASDLARGGRKSEAQLDQIAKRYPEEIRDEIRREGRDRYATWVEVYALELEAEQNFGRLLTPQPESLRSALTRLRSRPELLSILVDNIGITTRIGAAHRADPTRVEARFDTLSQEVSQKRRDQEQNWAQELQDPQAREELRTAAREFAEDQGYDLDEEELSDDRIQTRVVHVDHSVNVNPYPYWFGYPSWYAYPYWYPATVWSHLGFRYGRGSTFVSFGLPSPYFLGWYNDYYYGWGPGYGSWGYPSSYYSGGRPHRHFRSARYYDDHRPRHFYGHRRRHDRYDGGHHGGGGGGSYDRDRREAQERLLKRPDRDGWNRSGEPERADRRRSFDTRESGGRPDGGRRGDPRERLMRRDRRGSVDGVSEPDSSGSGGSSGFPGSSGSRGSASPRQERWDTPPSFERRDRGGERQRSPGGGDGRERLMRGNRARGGDDFGGGASPGPARIERSPSRAERAPSMDRMPSGGGRHSGGFPGGGSHGGSHGGHRGGGGGGGGGGGDPRERLLRRH